MTERRVVILGGYGVFGRHISENLSTASGVKLTIAGRSADKGSDFAKSLGVEFRQCETHPRRRTMIHFAFAGTGGQHSLNERCTGKVCCAFSG